MSLTQLGSANTSRINSGGPSGRLCSMVGPYARKKTFAQDIHGKFLPIRGSKPISERTEALILHRTDFSWKSAMWEGLGLPRHFYLISLFRTFLRVSVAHAKMHQRGVILSTKPNRGKSV